MEFERLKKSHRKQIVIGALAICIIGGALTFATTRAKYKLTEELPLASGTINYKPYDFKIMAMYKSDDKTNYTEINEMPGSDYVINESKTYCNLSNGNKDTTAVLKTINGNHTISKLKQNDRCYIWFDMKKVTSEETLAKLNITNVNTTTPKFNKAATTDEGIFKVSDYVYGGYSYYWRGAATTNHVIFANKCWRIVRINGDGTIRLIYNGTPSSGTCLGNGVNNASIISGGTYNSLFNNSSYVGWTYTSGSQRPSNNAIGTPSNAKTQTDTWYNNNIGNNPTYASKVADGKFCNDRSVQSDFTWSATESTFFYAARARLQTYKAPTLDCSSNDIYTLKIGTITMDEAMYAGGIDDNNYSYYLYNGQNYWTMSPYQWNGDITSASMYIIDSTGTIINWSVNSSYGLRPVINLKANTIFNSSANGTQNKPYVVQ